MPLSIHVISLSVLALLAFAFSHAISDRIESSLPNGSRRLSIAARTAVNILSIFLALAFAYLTAELTTEPLLSSIMGAGFIIVALFVFVFVLEWVWSGSPFGRYATGHVVVVFLQSTGALLLLIAFGIVVGKVY